MFIRVEACIDFEVPQELLENRTIESIMLSIRKDVVELLYDNYRYEKEHDTIRVKSEIINKPIIATLLRECRGGIKDERD